MEKILSQIEHGHLYQSISVHIYIHIYIHGFLYQRTKLNFKLKDSERSINTKYVL